jgi:hypothetical protein
MTSNVARCAQRASAAMLEVCSDAPWCRDCGFGHACGVAMAARSWSWKLALRLWKRRQMISRHETLYHWPPQLRRHCSNRHPKRLFQSLAAKGVRSR